ncbi:DMT family transporter [bacterium]|nr:DMT family transporter [bacterium]
MIQSNIGEWAALFAAFCWTITAMSFESAGKQVGSLPVNWIRLVMALIFFSVYSWIFRGWPVPQDASNHAWIWLTLSGLVGFVMGDLFLFRAFIEIGSRISMLIMASVPMLTTLMAGIWMDERLSGMDIFSMMLTVAGIMLVVMGRNADKKIELKQPLRGVMLAFGGALGQAVGLILSKYGMGHYDAFAATQIRVIAGVTGFSLLFFPLKRWGVVKRALCNSKGMIPITIGAFFGPFLGVGFSLLAIQNTLTGIASTIMAIVPILIIPPALIIFHERITIQEIVGAFVAVGGVALLFV